MTGVGLTGAAVMGQAVGRFSWSIVLCAMRSLAVVRMLPVFVSGAGLGIDSGVKLSLGWFGPRGLGAPGRCHMTASRDNETREVIWQFFATHRRDTTRTAGSLLRWHLSSEAPEDRRSSRGIPGS